MGKKIIIKKLELNINLSDWKKFMSTKKSIIIKLKKTLIL